MFSVQKEEVIEVYCVIKRKQFKYKGYLIGEGEADGLPPLDGDGDDQEDGGGEGKVTRALKDGEQEADGVKLGLIIH